jgi:serine/threonine-protein kinase
MIPEEGQIVGSYVLRHKIADGGMGSVWAAEHVTLNREVAVKFLANPLGDGVATARFALEARTIARLSNPHIPQIFDHGVADGGTPYIVMELVVGTNLHNWVAQSGCLDVAQVVRLVDQMSLALSAAHALGIVHRDVKPDNIILSGGMADFHAKLVDFGIAKSTATTSSRPSLTQEGTTIGTPSYMSPEQLMGASGVDARSDVWSLGVVAYWALTGKLPFEGETFAAVCIAITRAHFVPPSELQPGVPPALDTWFERALSRDPAERFQTAELMNRMLKVAAKTADWEEPIPLVPVPLVPGRATPAFTSTPELSMAGLSNTAGLRPAMRGWPWRTSALYAAGGAILAVAVVTGLTFMPGSAAGTASDVRPAAAPVVLAEATLPMPPPQVRASPPPPVPSPIPSPPTAAEVAHSAPLEPPPRRPQAVPTPPPSVTPASSAVVVVSDAAAPARPAATDWHPTDDMGEP